MSLPRLSMLLAGLIALVFSSCPITAAVGETIRITDGLSLDPAPGWQRNSMVDSESSEETAEHAASGPQKLVTLLFLAEKPAQPFPARFTVMWWAGPQAESSLESDAGKDQFARTALTVLMSQGFAPKDMTWTDLKANKQTPLVAIDITGRRITNEEQGIIVASTLDSSDPIRVVGTYPVSDSTARAEILGMISSMKIAAKPASREKLASAAPSDSIGSRIGKAISKVGDVFDTGRMVVEHRGSLLLVEGRKGVGSGFLCKMGDATMAVTNIHVLADNEGVKLTGLDRVQLPAGNAEIAVGHDVARIATKSESPPFELMEEVDKNVKIGDAVIVPGNSEGAGVVHPVSGRITGIGPRLIEVDAPFVSGNSGSPIIHVPTGKVIGVATFLVEKRVDEGRKGSVVVETRRFGYRLDSIAYWQPVNWALFFAQSAKVAAIEVVSEDFIRMFEDLQRTGRFLPDNYRNPGIVRELQNFERTVSRSGISASDAQSALRRLFAGLRTVSRNDIAEFQRTNAYDYFQGQVAEQAKFRSEIYKIFSDQMEKLF